VSADAPSLQRSLERSANSASSPEQPPPPLAVRSPAMGFRLALETTAAARSAASRARTPRGGTTIPGQGAVEARPRVGRPASLLASRTAWPVVSATNGKTTTTAMAAEISAEAPRARLEPRRARTSCPASRRRSVDARRAEFGLFEVDEACAAGRP
jgi:hypothetical protein